MWPKHRNVPTYELIFGFSSLWYVNHELRQRIACIKPCVPAPRVLFQIVALKLWLKTRNMIGAKIRGKEVHDGKMNEVLKVDLDHAGLTILTSLISYVHSQSIFTGCMHEWMHEHIHRMHKCTNARTNQVTLEVVGPHRTSEVENLKF